MLALIEAAIARGQRSGAVRPGDPATLARTVLLTAQSFLISGSTMLAPFARDNPGAPLTSGDLDAELATILERYLRP